MNVTPFPRWIGWRGTLALLLLVTVQGAAAGTHALDLSPTAPSVRRGHLDLGGTGPGGASIAVNSFYIEQNGRPFVPVVGEFHYCRYPVADWDEALRTMKAGGINVVATYVFWTLHERREGEFDWSGDLDLRRFVALAEDAGLQVIVRVGPFCHGEMRNGGLPDWLYGRAFEVRSNDPEYLGLVNKLYAEISRQITGQFFKDGGPIIGVQLENEFQHSAAPWDVRHTGAPIEWTVAARDVGVTHAGVSVSEAANAHAEYGSDHMVNLKRIAKKHGLDAPLYTATGWGNAAIVPQGSVPVSAAYPYPFWTKTPVASRFFLFKDLRKQPDYAPVSFAPELYPALPAEMGAGMCPTYARRAYVPEESVEPMVVRMLGSGSNGLGYYMYHGGATPVFDDRFYNEDASGLPKINYDYQSPIGQYGRVKEHYFSLRPLHLFLASYGERLAPLPTILPDHAASLAPTDTGTLRYAARAAEGSGFVFLVNFQDHAAMQELTELRLSLADGRRTIVMPSTGTFTLRAGTAAILPVNLDLDGVRLRSAMVQPLTILRGEGPARSVFFSIDGLPPELVFDAGTVTAAEGCEVEVTGGATIVRGVADRAFSFAIEGRPVLVVPRSLALEANVTPDGRLLFTRATLTVNGSELALRSAGATEVDVAVYPAVDAAPVVKGAVVKSVAAPLRGLSAFRMSFEPVEFSAGWRQVAPRRYAARFESGLGGLHDVFMRVNYEGDTAMAFIDGRMVDDHFYSGRPWEIGLKRFMPELQGREMVFVFHPMPRDPTYFNDLPDAARPTFAPDAKSHLAVSGIEFIPEYRAVLQLEPAR